MTLRVRWRSRIVGLVVLVLALLGAVVLAREGAAALSWVLVGALGGAALVASVSNFGDRIDVGESGLVYTNDLTARVGFPRRREAAWSAVLGAVEQDHETFFLDVEGQRRWVLDQLDGHEELRIALGEHGIPLTTRTRPRLMSWGRSDKG